MENVVRQIWVASTPWLTVRPDIRGHRCANGRKMICNRLTDFVTSTTASAECAHSYSGRLRGPPVDSIARASHAHMLRKNTLQDTVQRLGEPRDRAFDVMQFVETK